MRDINDISCKKMRNVDSVSCAICSEKGIAISFGCIR